MCVSLNRVCVFANLHSDIYTCSLLFLSLHFQFLPFFYVLLKLFNCEFLSASPCRPASTGSVSGGLDGLKLVFNNCL